MTDNEKLSCLIDRPCTACKFHKEEGCSKWSCVFEEESDVLEKGEWIPVYGKNGKTIMSYKCSKCNFHPKHAIITDFCGGCGADMRGVSK